MATPSAPTPLRVADAPPQMQAKATALADELWPQSFTPSRALAEKIGPPVNEALRVIAGREAAAGQQPEPGAA